MLDGMANLWEWPDVSVWLYVARQNIRGTRSGTSISFSSVAESGPILLWEERWQARRKNSDEGGFGPAQIEN